MIGNFYADRANDEEPESPTRDVFEQASVLEALRNEKAVLAQAQAAEMSALNKRIDTANNRIVETMMQMDPPLQRFSAGGKTFYIHTTTYVSTRKGSADLVREWLENNGHDSLVKPSVHASTLAGFVREIRKDSELPEELEALLNIYEKPEVRVRNG